MKDIRQRVFQREQLWNGKGGRDYLLVEGEICTIKGLYCNSLGKQSMFGQYVQVSHIRWPVVERRGQDLIFVGDSHDVQALDHYGYKWDSKNKFARGDWQRVPSFKKVETPVA